MSRDEQVEARARELVMAAYAEAGMQPQPWFLHDDPASFRGSDYFLFKAIIEALRGASGGGAERTDAPINIVLHCPTCGLQHIDEPVGEWDGEPWTNPPHRSHLCHGCGCIWRPADIATTGIAAVETRGKADNWPATESGRSSPASTGLIAGEAERRLSGACTVTASADHAASACSSDGSATPDHPAENAKSSGEVRATALNRYFHEAADAQEEADLLRAALENLADAADVVMGREVFEPTRWPEWIDLANASLAARAALARSGKGEG